VYIYYATQAEVILNHINPNVCVIGQGEAGSWKYKRLKLGGGKAYERSADYLQFRNS
jgi:hypothetical protein